MKSFDYSQFASEKSALKKANEKLKNPHFCGVYTALATPFRADRLDLNVFEKILNAQVKSNIDGLVLFGSTGEHFSLTEEEKKLIFFTAKEVTRGALPLICGAGSPSTKAALHDALLFKSYGAEGILLLPPFYYKCADNGLIAHFFEISQTVKLPTIIYNVPARTGVDLAKKSAVLSALYSMDYVAAIKQAEPNELKNERLIKRCKLPVLAGCDENSLAAYFAGAKGCVSVASNIFPKQVKEVYELFAAGNASEAVKKDELLKDIYKTLTLKSNPVPLKYAISLIYGGSGELRLPLTELDENEKSLVRAAIDDFKKSCEKERF